MSNVVRPKGRKNLPKELLQFGRHLVYSEGTKTEPYYVENIKDSIASKYNCPSNEIEIISVNKEKTSYNTIGLFKYAEKDIKKRLQKKEHIDHVWVFFDKDDFPFEDFNIAHKTIQKMNNSKDLNLDGFKYNNKTGIAWHSCWSNEAFELWLCLYFHYIESSLSREQYKEHLNNIPSLKKIGFNYEKKLSGIHKLLQENGGVMKNAIKHAKKLEELNGIQNPSTGVYQFAEYFQLYME